MTLIVGRELAAPSKIAKEEDTLESKANQEGPSKQIRNIIHGDLGRENSNGKQNQKVNNQSN